MPAYPVIESDVICNGRQGLVACGIAVEVDFLGLKRADLKRLHQTIENSLSGQ